jgi:putative colanic acid biosynthesis UDP-glucose lipid carrier transferase
MNSRFDSTLSGPAVYRVTFALAAINFLQLAAPAAISTLMLFGLCVAYEVEIDRNMLLFAGMAAALVFTMVRPTQDPNVTFGNQYVSMTIRIAQRWVAVLGMLLLMAYAAKLSSEFSRRVVFTWALVSPVAIAGISMWLREILHRALADKANQSNVLFVGFNEASNALAERLRRDKRHNMRVMGFFDDRSVERLGTSSNVPVLGRLPDVVEYSKTHSIDVIFIALPVRHIKRVLDLLEQLRDTTVSIYYVPDIYVFDLIQARTQDILGVPVVAMCESPFSGYRGVAKRLFDLAFTLALMPVLLPAMLAIAIGVKLSSPGPVIFKQRRYGLDGREIVVYKFRTMKVTQDGAHVPQAQRNDPRITPFGGFLRRYSLDELPQLFNVLRGTMSLVGPRPHAVAHNEQYRKLIKGYMVRHKVPPGITGLAQVNGCRGETPQLEQMQARVDFDLEYLRRWSPQLDIKILIATAFQLTGRGKAY